MKTYYELLGLQSAATTEEIKGAFRREIARYHPDKVQHLGTEFQEIAARRAAELTEAYRVLMDATTREDYDESLRSASADLSGDRAQPPSPPVVPPPEAPHEPSSAPRLTRAQVHTIDLVQRAVLARFRGAAEALGGTTIPAREFDAAFVIQGRKGLFRKAEPPVRLAMKVVDHVDPKSIEETWTGACRLAAQGETLCLMLLGSRVAPARDLAATVSELRRKGRRPGPLVIAIDVRDWEALLPPETPGTVRSLVEGLRSGL